MNTTVRQIAESDSINVGDMLIYQPPIGKARSVKVTRITKRYIFIGETKFHRTGYQIGDEFRRTRLFLEIVLSQSEIALKQSADAAEEVFRNSHGIEARRMAEEAYLKAEEAWRQARK